MASVRWAYSVGGKGLLVATVGLLAACSKKAPEAPSFLFYGECSVEVVSHTDDADIQIDGVSVGHESPIKVQIPCGEKQIKVVKEGFAPYAEFLPTTKAAPLKVEVTLVREEAQKNFALSSELLAQVAHGVKSPVDPSTPEGQKLLAKAEKEAAESMKTQIVAAQAAAKGGDAAAGGAAAAGGVLGPGPWDSVDYWR